MKKYLLIVVLVLTPILSIASNNETIEKKENTIKTEVVIKKVDPISINPKTQHRDLNFKKSHDLISVKAYIKSLKMKRKATLVS